MVETAQTIKKTVEEGKIDNIIDKVCSPFCSFRHLDVTLSVCVGFKHVSNLVPPVHIQTILGDFQKEQKKFVQEKKSKKSGECTSIF